MKKYIFTFLMVLFAGAISAATSRQVFITIDDESSFLQLNLIETDAVIANSALASEDLAALSVGLYVYQDSKAYVIYGQSEMSNTSLTFKTSNSTSYALFFASIIGDIVIYDAVADSLIHPDEMTPYEFTIPNSQRNSTISDRFVVFYQAAPAGPSAFGICYRGGKITVDNPEDNAMTVRIFDNATGTQVGSDETVAAHSTQDITPTLTAGELYKVEVYYQGAIYTESDSQQHHRIIRAE